LAERPLPRNLEIATIKYLFTFVTMDSNMLGLAVNNYTQKME